MSKALCAAVFASFALATACGSSDPAWIPTGPGATGTTSHDASAGLPGTPGGPTGSGTDKGDAGEINDANVDRDPGYRDPRQADGACAAPNKVCATGADAADRCIAVGTDVDNCGDCGKQCTGPGAACVASMCTCTDVGFDYCAGAGCMDVSADLNNCGKCGNVCDPNVFTDCTAGACVNNN